jgi:hypothetical protein
MFELERKPGNVQRQKKKEKKKKKKKQMKKDDILGFGFTFVFYFIFVSPVKKNTLRSQYLLATFFYWRNFFKK